MNSKEMTPKVAVDVAVFRENQGNEEVLLGKRKGRTAASGQWNFPGGHIKKGEKLQEAALREIREELGEKIEIALSDQIIGVIQNRLSPDYDPHVIIVLKALHLAGEPELMEPDKCWRWSWFPVDKMPRLVFSEVRQILINRSDGLVRVGTNWESKEIR